uniref:Translation initiation factor IF-3 n=1 Tax=Eucampia antarctica TaxID=49252 RepID=A0A7S2R258_9STRA|mmetsp:Transcript_13690/g.13262  ORF Transcript_13690/g.13262 Transcript_13690/m.13262 type:complete len:325 (+) Transcript_13690:71-1045(+)|eukprot:CAMPEP_0197824900 /NCGR_PEP_ID=MMETSP1437-20131217/2092_1 /TAXON_ID=49252 ORGANISM="Eucampia antarctica, Strain CCMP1452" /NCGR_SAMPLE_ID=MMETSP1437 /ASSEMBLY_ACC=CAM_ASM_001096 /LENGTH=324 /DNA_ID=CAMNT_0043424705 /DNA_START=69 /DNA_END=1043 /DNA_ORIENTATION=+
MAKYGSRNMLSIAAALMVVSSLCVSNVMGFTSSSNSRMFGITTSGVSTSSTELFLRRGGRPRGPVRVIEVKPPMNNEIEFDELRVTALSSSGKDEALGVMSKSDAIAKAKELGNLDLILINAQTKPPVCKIADYSKYRYIKEKKAKEVKKNSKASELKEVKMSYNIGDHDYQVRKKNASKFIIQGNRVRCTVVFKGREVQHDKIGVALLHRLQEDLGEICTMEGKPRREGRFLACTISPRQEVVKKIGENKRAAEKAKKKEKDQKKKDKADTTVAASEAAAVTAEVNDEQKPTSVLDLNEHDENVNESLDDLLGGDDLTDDLFS